MFTLFEERHVASTEHNMLQSLDSLPTWALITLCLVYCVSPVDLIPFCPIDDAGVLAWTVWTVVKRFTRSSTHRPGQKPAGEVGVLP